MNSIKTGDKVTATIAPARNGQKSGFLRQITLKKTGKILRSFSGFNQR